MLARAQHVRRHADGVAAGLECFDRRTGRDASHDRHGHGTVAVILTGDGTAAPNLAKRAFDDARREAAPAVAGSAGEFRKLDHFDSAGAIGEATNEAAFFKGGDQAVDAGLRAQVERVLHLVEGGRHARLLQPFADEPQKFVLFARQHLDKSPGLLFFNFRDSNFEDLKSAPAWSSSSKFRNKS